MHGGVPPNEVLIQPLKVAIRQLSLGELRMNIRLKNCYKSHRERYGCGKVTKVGQFLV